MRYKELVLKSGIIVKPLFGYDKGARKITVITG